MSIPQNVERAKNDYDRAYAAGKQAEYDAFWDAFIRGGNVNYRFLFAGAGWNKDTFYPKCDISGNSVGYHTFNSFNYNGVIFDLAARLQECGVVLDTSRGTTLESSFQNAWVSRLPEISVLSATSYLYYTFGASKVQTIDRLVLKADGSNTFLYTFYVCYDLENLTIEGTIGQNGFDVQWSTKLSKTSITSIINALSTTTSSLTVTLSRTAVNNAFETSEGAADGSASEEWLALVATKSNWTIALA